MQPLEYGNYYHIYNRGINSCNLFEENTNLEHFLHLYEKYIFPIADTFAWVLMKNHFHILIRIKEEKEIGFYKKLNSDRSPDGYRDDSVRFQTITNPIDLSECEAPDRVNYKKPSPTKHFSHLFNAYTRYFNKKYNRTGSLFQRPFKRILIEDENYLKHLVYYIHHNPVKHGFTDDLTDYPWSSYLSIASPKRTNLRRKEVIEWFDNLENFRNFHATDQSIEIIKNLI